MTDPKEAPMPTAVTHADEVRLVDSDTGEVLATYSGAAGVADARAEQTRVQRTERRRVHVQIVLP